MARSVWQKSNKGMRCTELRKPISSFTLNIICRMFAGRTFSDQELGGGEWFLKMMDEIMHLGGVFVLGDYIPFLAFLDLGGFCRRMQAAHKIYDEFADNLIDEHVERRRAKKSESLDIVDVLLDMAESDNSTIEVSRVQMKAIIWDMLSGGVETSAATVEWAMTELLRNPQVMARAQQEIDLQVGRDRIVRESDIVNLEYLRCVVNETFRLHPRGPLLVPHESTEGCNVGGYYIPPKTRLYVNIWAIGRDERRRGCPGIPMGLANVYLVLAQLIHCFDWSAEGDLDRDEEFGLTLPRKRPLSALPSWRLTTDEPL
ncbi:hypothetical protein SUGI_0958500 [Cryptomeria japonica]|nr:hypothetical protein SUGI_0958500 [Cryptomeria japonica]